MFSERQGRVPMDPETIICWGYRPNVQKRINVTNELVSNRITSIAIIYIVDVTKMCFIQVKKCGIGNISSSLLRTHGLDF